MKKMSDKMAPNSVRDHMDGKTKDNYAVHGMHVKPIGDVVETAKLSKAPMRGSALEQMSNGSMNYLQKEDATYASMVKKIKNHACKY